MQVRDKDTVINAGNDGGYMFIFKKLMWKKKKMFNSRLTSGWRLIIFHSVSYMWEAPLSSFMTKIM